MGSSVVSSLCGAVAPLGTHQWSLALEEGSVEIHRRSAGGENIPWYKGKLLP